MIALLLLVALESPSMATPKSPQEAVHRAWNILDKGLDNKDASKRAKAVHALGLLRASQRALKRVEKALQDDNAYVRVEAAAALGRLGATSARAKLRRALDDKDVKVVIAAANALYQLKDPIAFDVYYAILVGERKGSPGLVQSQLDRLRNRTELEKLAFQAGIGFVPFGSMGYEAWKTITTDNAAAVRVLAAERLAHDPDPKSADALIESRFDKSWQVRAAVASAIAERRERSLLEPVAAMMDDGNDNVRFDAAATVVQLFHMRSSRKK